MDFYPLTIFYDDSVKHWDQNEKYQGQYIEKLKFNIKNDKINIKFELVYQGIGICIKDNTVYEGLFIDGLINGFGTIIYKDGKMYKGSIKNNLKHGIGILYNNDATIANTGNWHNDEFLTVMYEYYPDTNKIKSKYNFINNLYFEYNENNIMTFQGIKKNDIKVFGIEYRDNGTKKFQKKIDNNLNSDDLDYYGIPLIDSENTEPIYVVKDNKIIYKGGYKYYPELKDIIPNYLGLLPITISNNPIIFRGYLINGNIQQGEMYYFTFHDYISTVDNYITFKGGIHYNKKYADILKINNKYIVNMFEYTNDDIPKKFIGELDLDFQKLGFGFFDNKFIGYYENNKIKFGLYL
jgi:hypothetical protein